MKKKVINQLLIFMAFSLCICKNSHEKNFIKIVILYDNTSIMDSSGKNELIRLNFGDVVQLKSPSNNIKNMLVVSINNTEGIVDKNNTSYLSDGWFEYNELNGVNFSLPNKYKSSIDCPKEQEGKEINFKAYDDNLTIDASLTYKPINELLANYIDYQKEITGKEVKLKEIKLDGYIIYYHKGLDPMESSLFDTIYLQVTSNKTFIMSIFKNEKSIITDDIIKKILFSVRLKK